MGLRAWASSRISMLPLFWDTHGSEAGFKIGGCIRGSGQIQMCPRIRAPSGESWHEDYSIVAYGILG